MNIFTKILAYLIMILGTIIGFEYFKAFILCPIGFILILISEHYKNQKNIEKKLDILNQNIMYILKYYK